MCVSVYVSDTPYKACINNNGTYMFQVDPFEQCKNKILVILDECREFHTSFKQIP